LGEHDAQVFYKFTTVDRISPQIRARLRVTAGDTLPQSRQRPVHASEGHVVARNKHDA
jgi:hypothetical protein